MKKYFKWYILIIMFFLCLIIIPFTFSKYATTIRETITLNARQPEYDVIFSPNTGILSSEYTELEYIESQNNAYILTDVMSDNNYIKFDVQYAVTTLPTSWYMIFGTWKDDSSNTTRLLWRAGGNNVYGYVNSRADNFATLDTTQRTINTIYTETLERNGNNIKYVSSTGVTSQNMNPTSATEFSGNMKIGMSNLRIYYFKIYDNGTLIRDYVPCFRNSDGEVGLYDLANNEFHTNDSTTSNSKFIKGKTQHFVYGTAQNLVANTYTREGYIFNGWNTKYDGSGTSYTDEEEVNNLTDYDGDEIKLYAQWESIPYVVKFNPNTNKNFLPNGYQELEYIESTGTQYIDSGYKPTLNTGVEATFQFTDATTTQQRLFGVSSDTSVNDLLDFEFYINSTRSWGYAFRNNAGTGGWSSTNIAANTDKHTLYFNDKNDKTLFISNTSQVIYSKIANNATMTSSNYNIYIFGRNYYYNELMGPGQYGKIKLYSFKIYEDGVLQMNFVPCYEIASGKAGLYDTIGNEFYPSSRVNYDFLRDGKTYSQDFDYGTPQNLLANTFTRAGYEFTGWNTEPDGSGTSYTDQELIFNLTTTANDVVNLYAIWNQNSYTVNYYPNRTNTTYREVEYVESTGNQYINIGYYISGTTGVKAEYEYTSLTTQQRIFGTEYYQLYINGNGYYGYLFSNNTTNWKTNNITVDKGRHTVEFNKDLGRLKFDNGYLYNNANLLTGLTNTSTRPLGVMAYSGGSNKAKIKIYNFTLYESGETTSEFIPCYRLSDSTPGLCNITDNAFYPSSASGMLKGDDILKTQLFTLNQSQNLNVNTYTRAGYIFNGWNTMPDGSGTTYTDEELINLNVSAGTIINLYAQWKAYKYNISFHANGGIGTMNDQEMPFNEPTALSANSFTKTGYIFNNWNTELDGSGTSYTDKQVVNRLSNINNDTIDLYAQWILDEAFFDGDNSSSILTNVTQLTNIRRFEKYTGSDSDVETLISNGTAEKIDDGTTPRSIYAWNDNGTIYWWTDAYKAYLLDKSHYLWSQLTNAEYIDVTGIDTSKVTNMSSMFSSADLNASTFKIVGLNNFDTSNVTNMSNMFNYAGYTAATFDIGDIGNWNVSKVKNMSNMFNYAGYTAATFDIGDIGNWNVSSVTSMSKMFMGAGYSAETFDIGDIGNWNVSKVTSFYYMFNVAGYKASTWNIGDLSDWDTSQVKDMGAMFRDACNRAATFDIGNIGNWDVSKVNNFHSMFSSAGYNASTWNIGNLSDWTLNTTNDVNMFGMFYRAGYSAGTFNIGNLGDWDVSKVNDFQSMFSNAGYNASTWNIGDLSSWSINTTSDVTMTYMFSGAGYSAGTFNIGDIGNWDVSHVKSMAYMFSRAGRDATIWSIGDLSNWDTSNVPNMISMFDYAGYNATTWNSIGTLKVYATNITSMFSNCPHANGTINIYINPTSYVNVFRNAATSGSGIVVNYSSNVTDIDNIIATKSASSNVTKGSLLN